MSGQVGVGKTTLGEAILWCLYGSVKDKTSVELISWGAKKCDGNERWGMGSGRRVKGLGKGTRRVERRRWEIGGREEDGVTWREGLDDGRKKRLG